jgi:host factor-I protein
MFFGIRGLEMASGSKVCDAFLKKLLEEKSAVVVFLINGVKLQGVVDDYDECSVLLKRDQYVQLLFRHAISTVIPQGEGKAY